MALADGICRLLSEALAAGVRLAVVSPGSRSTPLVWALHKAQQEGADLRVVVAVDEREAAFLALGAARASFPMPMLVCTSGSAPAHYYPAVIEASESFLPLLVVSADRPRRLLGTGANQTTDQRELFGGHVRAFLDVADPRLPEGAAALKAVPAALAMGLAPVPGPVHINVRLDKPLEPELADRPAAPWRWPRGSALPETAPPLPQAMLHDVAQRIGGAARGVVVAGPWSHGLHREAGADPRALRRRYRTAVHRFCQRYGFALCAESTSQLRHTMEPCHAALPPMDLLFRSPACLEAHAFDFVLQLGALPASGGYERWASGEGASVPRLAVHPHRPPDPFPVPATRVEASPLSLLEALLADGDDGEGDAVAAVAAAAATPAFSVVAASLAKAVTDCARVAETPEGALSEVRAMQLVFEALPERATVFLGNSLPVRNVDRWVSPQRKDLTFLSQRGVSGIDGLFSGAFGAALVSDEPLLLLLGDVSALHGLAGLLAAEELNAVLPQPVVLLVLNNQGGRIFERLPVTGLRAFHETRAWSTPHRQDFAHAADFYRVRFRRSGDEATLSAALLQAFATPGVTLLEACLPPHGIAQQDKALDDTVAALSPPPFPAAHG